MMNNEIFKNTLHQFFHKLHSTFEQIPPASDGENDTETMVQMFVLFSIELSLAILSKGNYPADRVNLCLDVLKETIGTFDRVLRTGDTGYAGRRN